MKGDFATSPQPLDPASSTLPPPAPPPPPPLHDHRRAPADARLLSSTAQASLAIASQHVASFFRPEAGAAPQQALPRIPLPPIDQKIAMSTVVRPSALPSTVPKMSMTSREWIVPPRPKPGRKPATDTPPTKRKAQNRAAQRAFRERRAARVGELEELLDDQKKSQDVRELELHQRIRDLEMEVQSFRSRCLLLESMLERERQERIRAEMQAASSAGRRDAGASRTEDKQMASVSQAAFPPHHGQARRSLLEERLTHGQAPRHFSISQIITPPETENHDSPHDSNGLHDASLSCGNCTPNGACACAEEALAAVVNGCGKCSFGTSCMCLDEAMKIADQPDSLKRPASPAGQGSEEKRPRPDAPGLADSEVDFTAMFSSRKLAVSSSQPPSMMPQPSSSMDPISFRDGCGFCKDGTYCVCAEAAMATPAPTPTDAPLAPEPLTRQTRTPPPSEHDVRPLFAMEMTADGAVMLPRRKPKSQPAQPGTPARGCGPNGPGTCAQCQADPKSGLFCRLMAANLERGQDKNKKKDKDKSGGCCGGGGGGGGCCKAEPRPKQNITLPSLPSLGLSCAEAYQTLSSHRNFDRAADDIGSWLPKLKATPAGASRAPQPGLMPIEVEAASIMSVLKEFDVRFDKSG